MAEREGDVVKSEDSPQVLEAEIRRTRAEMDRTIDEIGERLQPSHLLSAGFSKLMEDIQEGTQKAQKAFRVGREASRERIEAYVERHTVSAVVGAFVVGLLAGLIVSREHSLK